jgi:hypothetical protein
MLSARESFTHLVELASAPEQRHALAGELCDLLLDWPASYPSGMRGQIEALLKAISGELDAETRRMVVERLAVGATISPSLLNEFFFDASLRTKRKILLRNGEPTDADRDGVDGVSDERLLVEATRAESHAELAKMLAQVFSIPDDICERILADKSGRALAVACKGVGVSRAKFSTLAVLAGDAREDSLDACYRRLAAFDEIPEPAAARVLQFWRAKDATALRHRAA